METNLPTPMTGRVVMLIYWRVGFCSTNGGFSTKKRRAMGGHGGWDQWWMRMVLFGIMGLLKKMGKTWWFSPYLGYRASATCRVSITIEDQDGNLNRHFSMFKAKVFMVKSLFFMVNHGIMWVKEWFNKPPMGMVNIPPIKMAMTGG